MSLHFFGQGYISREESQVLQNSDGGGGGLAHTGGTDRFRIFLGWPRSKGGEVNISGQYFKDLK